MVGSQSLAPQELSLVPPCVLERDRAPARESTRAGSGDPATSGARATPPPLPVPAALSLFISANRLQTARTGPGLMQSARYLGRRLHYQPGPSAGQNQPARQPAPLGRPRLQRSSGCARAPRRGTWPRPAPRSPARRVLSGPGARPPGSRCCRTRECAPLEGPAGWTGETQAGARRARAPASLTRRGVRVRGGSRAVGGGADPS